MKICEFAIKLFPKSSMAMIWSDLSRERHNDLPGRLILQDLPETINSIEKALPGIEPMIYDFFGPQPVIGESADPRPAMMN